MERYILLHDKADERKKEFDELRLIAECHSKRYPVIKQWFLQQYPEMCQVSVCPTSPKVPPPSKPPPMQRRLPRQWKRRW